MNASTKKSYSKVLELLAYKGYRDEFIVTDEGFQSVGNEKTYSPEDLVVLRQYRFDIEAFPNDIGYLHAVKAKDGAKGYIVSPELRSKGTQNGKYGDFLKRMPVDELLDL